MISLRQFAESLLVLPPIVSDIRKLISFLKFFSNIIRATDFIEESVTADDLKSLLIRIEFRNRLHYIELRFCHTGLRIVCKEILDSLDQLAALTAGKRFEIYCPE